MSLSFIVAFLASSQLAFSQISSTQYELGGGPTAYARCYVPPAQGNSDTSAKATNEALERAAQTYSDLSQKAEINTARLDQELGYRRDVDAMTKGAVGLVLGSAGEKMTGVLMGRLFDRDTEKYAKYIESQKAAFAAERSKNATQEFNSTLDLIRGSGDREAIGGHVDSLLKSTHHQIKDPALRQAAHDALLAKLTELAALDGADLKRALEEGAKHELQIEHLAITQKVLSERVSQLESSTKILKKALDAQTAEIKLQGQLLQNVDSKVGLLLVQEFNRMNPAEKLRALDDPRYGLKFKSEDDKAALRKNLEILKTADDIQNAAAIVTGGAQAFAVIAERLGLDPKVVSAINRGAQIANGAANIAASFLKGDVLGIFNALGSIFGGTDVAAERHKQLVELLDKVLQGQEEILKNQLHQINLAYRALDTIAQLANSMAEMRRELHEGFSRMHFHLETISDQIQDVKEYKVADLTQEFLGKCQDVKNSLPANLLNMTSKYWVEGLSIQTQADRVSLRRVLESNSDALAACRIQLRRFLAAIADFTTDNAHPNYKQVLFASARAYEDQYYKSTFLEPAYSPLLKLVVSGPRFQRALEMPLLTRPSLTEGDLTATPLTAEIVKTLRKPLSPDQLFRVGNFLQLMFVLDQFRQEGPGRTTPGRVDWARESDLFRSDLRLFLSWIDVLVAQQSVISGVPVIPAAMEKLPASKGEELLFVEKPGEKPGTTPRGCDPVLPKSSEQELVCAMQASPYIAHNWILASIYRRLEDPRCPANFMSYRDWLETGKSACINDRLPLIKGSRIEVDDPRDASDAATKLLASLKSESSWLQNARRELDHLKQESRELHLDPVETEEVSRALETIEKMTAGLDAKPPFEALRASLVIAGGIPSIRFSQTRYLRGVLVALRKNIETLSVRVEHLERVSREKTQISYLDFGADVRFRLPTADEVKANRFAWTPQLQEALDWRARVVDAIALVDLEKSLGKKDVAALHQAIGSTQRATARK